MCDLESCGRQDGRPGKRDGAGRRYGYVFFVFINICITNAMPIIAVSSGAHDLIRSQKSEQCRVKSNYGATPGCPGVCPLGCRVGRGSTWAMGEARAARLQRRRDAEELDESQEEQGQGQG